MKEIGRVDFGAIKIHKKVLQELVITAVSNMEGVSIPPKDILSETVERLGFKWYPVVKVETDKNNQVTLEVKVRIRYGLNIPEVARHAQEVIREAIENATDVDVKDIHINVQGIERRVRDEI